MLNAPKSATPPIRPLLVIPTFNHGATLADVIVAARAQITDILVIDDGSTDQTGDVLARMGVDVKRHVLNAGKGAALRTAFDEARQRGFSHVITMDADGQHAAADLPLFLSAIHESPATIIIGSRNFASGGDVPESSRFGRAFSDFWVRLESGCTVHDTQSGFRAYPVMSLPDGECRNTRYDFEVEIVVRSIWHGMAVRSIPVSVHYPPRDSRISHFLPWRDNWRLTRLHTRLCVTRILRLFTVRRHRSVQQERRGAFLLAWFMRHGGPILCYLIAPFVLPFYYLARDKERNGIIKLHRALGVSNPLMLHWHAFQNYLHFAAGLIDRMALASGKSVMPAKHDGLGPIPDFSRPLVLIGAHQGDWLLSGICLTRAGLGLRRLSLVIDLRLSPDFMARFQKSFASEDCAIDFIDASQPGMGVVLDVRNAISNGNTVCFLGDRGHRQSRCMNLPFLGKPASFPVSGFDLGMVLHVPVWTFFSSKSRFWPRTIHQVNVQCLHDGTQESDSTATALRFIAALENHVRNHPHDWFNFFDIWAES